MDPLRRHEPSRFYHTRNASSPQRIVTPSGSGDIGDTRHREIRGSIGHPRGSALAVALSPYGCRACMAGVLNHHHLRLGTFATCPRLYHTMFPHSLDVPRHISTRRRPKSIGQHSTRLRVWDRPRGSSSENRPARSRLEHQALSRSPSLVTHNPAAAKTPRAPRRFLVFHAELLWVSGLPLEPTSPPWVDGMSWPANLDARPREDTRIRGGPRRVCKPVRLGLGCRPPNASAPWSLTALSGGILR